MVPDSLLAGLPPGTFPGWDAAFVPRTLPAGYAGVYIGGSDAFRVATDAELARVAEGLVLPIWVPSPWSDNPRQTALQAAARLEQIGVPRYARPYRALMIDLETWADPAWLEAFAGRFISQGYDTIPYGSPGTLFSQPRRLGYAVASPTGNPHVYQHPGVIITQWAWDLRAPSGELYDADLAVSWLAKHLGPLQLPRPAAPAAGLPDVQLGGGGEFAAEGAPAALIDAGAPPAAGSDPLREALGPGRFVQPDPPPVFLP